MKKTILLFLTVVTFISIIPLVSSGPLRHYTFEETSGTDLEDSSDNADPTGNVSSDLIWSADGKILRGIDLDNQYFANVNFGESLSTWTIFVWAKLNGAADNDYIFGDSTESNPLINIDANADLQIKDHVDQNNVYNIPALGTHYNLFMITSTPDETRVYVNCTESPATFSGTNTPTWALKTWRIGKSDDVGSSLFDGNLDGFRMYNANESISTCEFVFNSGAGTQLNDPAPIVVINNTLPSVNISFPVNGSRIDNSSLYPLKINGIVFIQNGTVQNITINDTNWFNLGNHTNFNFTFNGSFREGFWSINISANSTDGNRSDTIISFYIDTTTPVAVSSLENNHTLFYAHQNITFDINITDNLLLFSLNVSTPEGYIVSFDNVNTTKYIFNGSINVSDYGIGLHEITTEFCDAHTDKDVRDFHIIKDPAQLKLTYQTPEDNIGIKLKSSTATLQDFGSIRKRDRYIFWFDFAEQEDGTVHTYKFKVDNKKELHYLAGSSFKGHFVTKKSWIDFQFAGNEDAIYTVKQTQDGKFEVTIQTTKTYLYFESIGDLNCGKRTWEYYIFNYTATLSTSAIETTKDLINLQIDFADIILNGNGTLNYDGISYNTSNVKTTTQINLTINFTIPQASLNVSNVTLFWNFNLNESLFTTINFTQEITRIQLALCGSLTSVHTLNISIFNEEIISQHLEASVDAVFNVWTNDSTNLVNFTFDFDGQTNYSICMFPNTTLNINAQFFYNTTGGFREKWFLRSAKLTTNTSFLNLYNFKSTTGIDELRGILRDSKFGFFKSIYTELQRFYPTENIWRTIQMDQSDDFGNVLFHITEGTQDYRLIFITDFTRIDDTNSLKFLCDTNNICEVTFLIDDSTAITDPELLFHHAYNNISQMFQLNWSDTTGLTNSIRLRVTKESGAASINICDTTISASSGTINCNTTGYNGVIKAEIYKQQSPERPIIVVFINKVIDKLYQLASIGKKEAGLWATGISATFIIAGVTVGGPAGAIMAYIFSLIVIFLLGIQNFVTITFISLVATVGVIVAILIRKER